MNRTEIPLTGEGFAPPPPAASPDTSPETSPTSSPAGTADGKVGTQGGFEPPRPGLPPGPAGPDVLENIPTK